MHQVYEQQLTSLQKKLSTDMTKTERNKIRALCSQLRAKCSELPDYAQKLHHFAEQHIVLDPEDGIKFNYSKLAPLLTKIH